MRIFNLLLICILPLALFGREYKSHSLDKEVLTIQLEKGEMKLIPLTEHAVRIKYYQQSEPDVPEIIYTSYLPPTDFKVIDFLSKIEYRGKQIVISFDKQTGALSFADHSGNVFLREEAGSRLLVQDSLLGQSCFIAQQSFYSPANEFIFGLGQFQDNLYNLRGLSRRLTQVNSQIAIPFIYSDQGYGLLWHQYGLTDFNPVNNQILLEKKEQSEGTNQQAEVTTTSGTQKISQNQSLYTSKFTVPEKGSYVLFMDLGSMGNRHFVAIDGKKCIDQSNMWLPPTVSARVELNAGEHKVLLICKSDNTPKLYWKRIDDFTTFRSPNAKLIDYTVFYGPSADTVISNYRTLSGNAPMFPQWAYGFWQCRERYSSGNQLVETVKEFRNRKLPMDVIVQDWQYWGSHGWGVPQFDETNYLNPEKFISEIHNQHAHFNISIWSNPDKNSDLGKEFMAKGLFIPNTKWLDYFNPETRKEYWNTLKTNMFNNGVDSWWMDAVEPENDALKGVSTYAGNGDFYRLTYPLMVSKAVYEGQRATSSEKRVCILTRSAFLGQQRFGIINWSGDIGGNWDTFRRQIVAGLNYSITGLPYWTTDIGGFFRPGPSQYTDENYHELLVRWFQWGAFNPIFRIHGYMSETEPWKYGAQVEDNMRKILNLRYQFLPYIYSEAWQITKNGSTIMRPMVMDFRNDPSAINCQYQFMFGKSILVCPIVEPSVSHWKVYLPNSSAWYNFWTGEKFEGGRTILTDASIDKIPFFIKAGSIIPIGNINQYAGEKLADTLEIRIYKGANGSFNLYEDEGDSYNYEKEIYSTINFTWNETDKTLIIGERKGSFPGMLENRIFNVVLVTNKNGNGPGFTERVDRSFNYSGKKIETKF
jgi:alpha-D-xyloside xylohydrolase